jgi:hypothetical protein
MRTISEGMDHVDQRRSKKLIGKDQPGKGVEQPIGRDKLNQSLLDTT